jgi:hypothetical protein
MKRVGREVVISFDDFGLVGLGQHHIVPDGFLDGFPRSEDNLSLPFIYS